MTRNTLYTLVSLIVASVVLGIFAWSVFLGRQVKETNLTTQYQPPGYAPSVLDLTVKSAKSIIDEVAKQPFQIQKQPEHTTPPFKIQASELVTEPVAGYGVVFQEVRDGFLTDTIFYTLVKNGHTFFYTLSQKPSKRRILQSTIPAVQEAVLVDTTYLLRRFVQPDNSTETITTVGNRIPQTTQEPATPEPQNITDIDYNPITKQVVYIKKSDVGSEAVLWDLRNNTRRSFWSSFLRDWHIAWSNANHVIIWQKPSAKEGSAIFYLQTDKTNERILAHRLIGVDIQPLQATSSLVSIIENNKPKLGIMSLPDGKITFFDPPLYTFAQKCVADPQDTAILYCFIPEHIPNNTPLPDAWLQGQVGFHDALWKINRNTGTREKIYPPADAEVPFRLDAVHVTINPSGTSIYAIDKTTRKLWRIMIASPYVKEDIQAQ